MILRRKSQPERAPQVPTLDTPEKIRRMTDGDLFLLAETSILNGGHYLTMYRTAVGDESTAALEWAIANMYTAQVACAELQERQVAMQ